MGVGLRVEGLEGVRIQEAYGGFRVLRNKFASKPLKAGLPVSVLSTLTGNPT